MLEWDKLELATASFRSLSLYRNGTKAGNIPFQSGGKREVVLSTKISGLAVDTEYVFHLILRTSAGTYSSEKLRVRTHKMTDLTGITVSPGVLDPQILASLRSAVDRIGGKLADTVRIDTTHFVCTEGRGKEWERAVEMNIPVVRPEWVEGCEREGRIVGVRAYYLNADPRLRQAGQGVGRTVIQTQSSPQQPPLPEAVDRRDMALPSRSREERDSEARLTAGRGGGMNGRPQDLSSPPPPTPAKDYKTDPMSVASNERPVADAQNIRGTSEQRKDERSDAESEAVSPMTSEDREADALGISVTAKDADISDEEDDEDEDQTRRRRADVRLPESESNFSEVQL